MSGEGATSGSEVASKSLDINNHGGGVNDL